MAEITSGENLTVVIMDQDEVDALRWIIQQGVDVIESSYTIEEPNLNAMTAMANAFQVLDALDISFGQ